MIDMTKKYTFNGLPARVVCTDVVGDGYPVLALVNVNGFDEIVRLKANGKSQNGDHLVEVKPDVIVWSNAYPTGVSGVYGSRIAADNVMRTAVRTHVIEHNITQRTSTWHEVEK